MEKNRNMNNRNGEKLNDEQLQQINGGIGHRRHHQIGDELFGPDLIGDCKYHKISAPGAWIRPTPPGHIF